jgi:hypothetical protein
VLVSALAPASPLANAASPAAAASALPGFAADDPVVRPEPGLARGHWEAPAWVFLAVAAAAVLGGLAWFALALRARKALR